MVISQKLIKNYILAKNFQMLFHKTSYFKRDWGFCVEKSFRFYKVSKKNFK